MSQETNEQMMKNNNGVFYDDKNKLPSCIPIMFPTEVRLATCYNQELEWPTLPTSLRKILKEHNKMQKTPYIKSTKKTR